jgi:hypothetical protein
MLLSSIPVPIRNQIGNAGVPYPDLEQGGGKALGIIISNTYPIFITLALIAAFAYLIWSGYGWITAGGDTNKVESSKKRITNAIIGLAIIASAFATFSIIDKFYGLGIAKKTSSNTPKKGCAATGCGPGFACNTGTGKCLPVPIP